MSQSYSFTVKRQIVFDQNNSESVTNFLGDAFGVPRIGTGGLALSSFPVGNLTSSFSVTSQSFTAAAPYQVMALPNSTVSTTPSWVGSLATASIASDTSAAIVDGQVTYSGLLTLLNDVDSTLSSSKTTLSAAQLSDLTTIAANLNNGVTTSAYLTGIMDSLVTGNKANATWTGGNASSVALGNLAAGASATQLSELIGKWFLGTDLPSSQVNVSGAQSPVAYSNSPNPLFRRLGPQLE